MDVTIHYIIQEAGGQEDLLTSKLKTSKFD